MIVKLWQKPLVYTTAGLASVLFLSACATDRNPHDGEDHHANDSQAGHHDGDNDQHHGAAEGQPGVAADVSRRIEIGMNDNMDFIPTSLTVAQDETIEFVVTNQGALVHEFVIGSEEALLEHHDLMKRFPGMEHDEPNQVVLDSEQSGSVIWTFANSGTVVFACLQPGHYEAGMKGEILVTGL